MEHILRNSLLTLLDRPEATLGDINRLFEDRSFRQRAVGRVANPQVRSFWLKEYEKFPERFRLEAIAPIQNKVGAFLSHPVLSGVLLEQPNNLDLREIMDSGKILLINLAKGSIGADGATLMGVLLVAQIGAAGLSRAETLWGERSPFFLYLDEFQTFSTLSLANMLSEIRKYGIGLILSHQYLSQIEPEVRDAILGNAPAGRP